MSFKSWFLSEQDLDNKINSLLDSAGYVLFFKKDNSLFGADEDSRVVFAKIKNPDEDLPSGWDEEASFCANNLEKEMKGESPTHLFKKEDFKKIKVINRDELFEELKKRSKKLGDKAFKDEEHYSIINIADILNKNRDQATNFFQVSDDK